jgi:alpha-ketoglutarate-dependent taurine dioxygenase
MRTAEDARPRRLESTCEWRRDDVADPAIWTVTFDDDERDELDAALRAALGTSRDILDLGAEHFPLDTLQGRLADVNNELINGRGFVRLRGIERDRYTTAEMELIYWGIGSHLGSPWAQNKHGHVLGDVIDQGKAFDDPTARGNELGGVALPFHCDGSDLVGLMCLQNGRTGGLSLVANSVTIHNRMVEEAPDLAAELYKPQPNDYRGEQPAGKAGWYTLPVFTEWKDRLFVRCIPPYIHASQRHTDAPRLTEAARAGLELVVEWANDQKHHVAMELEPGDIQLINNYHVMHGRTAYEDDAATGSVRHLKRLWLESPMLTSRPEQFANGTFRHWESKRSVSTL